MCICHFIVFFKCLHIFIIILVSVILTHQSMKIRNVSFNFHVTKNHFQTSVIRYAVLFSIIIVLFLSDWVGYVHLIFVPFKKKMLLIKLFCLCFCCHQDKLLLLLFYLALCFVADSNPCFSIEKEKKNTDFVCQLILVYAK